MKHNIAICCMLFLVMIVVAGCTADNENTESNEKEATFSLEKDTLPYTQTLIDYQSVIEERLSDTFESDYNSGVDLLAKSPPNLELAYEWHSMIVEAVGGLHEPTISSFGYAFVDVNGDDVKEMLWIREDYVLLAIYTLYNGEPLLLDAFWPRHKAVFTDSGELYTRDSGGAQDYKYTARMLTTNGSALFPVATFGSENGVYYENIDGNKVTINKERFDDLVESYPNISLGVEMYLQVNDIVFLALQA